jgi:RNA polymerase sigma factor for flagellar operon FliA
VSEDLSLASEDPSTGTGDSQRLAVWQEWIVTRSIKTRDALVEGYLPLARIVAGRLYRSRADSAVQFDDYLQYARIGLLESVERFDPSRGASFQSFAFHRIRGAILNGLTRESELAAQREAARRKARERRESLMAQGPSGIERATLDDLIELTIGLALGALLDEQEEAADESPHANPYAAVEINQLRRLTWAAVERLPQRERELIRAHYYEQREFQEIAVEWAVTAGRISQLHGRAINQLRALLAEQPKLNLRL